MLVERLDQWIHYVMYEVDSLHLDELLLKVFTYDMKPSLYMLELLVRPGLLSKGYGSLLSQYSVMAFNVITPSFAMNFLNQKTSLVALEVMMYSTFMIESAMIGCLKFFQLTAPPLHKKIHPDVDFLLSTSIMKFESVYSSTFNFDPLLKINNKFLVLLKYLRMFFTAIQYSSSRFA